MARLQSDFVSAVSHEFRADREALGRALWNLLDNAVKYSARGSASKTSGVGNSVTGYAFTN
ncbi:MAG: ATP-binding protein [Acidobacteriota bacterium]